MDNNGPYKWKWFYAFQEGTSISQRFINIDHHKLSRPELSPKELEGVARFHNLNVRCKNRKVLSDPHLLEKFGLIDRSAEVPAPQPARKPKAPQAEVPKKKGKAVPKVLSKGKEVDLDALRVSKGPREFEWLKKLDLPVQSSKVGDIHSSGGSDSEGGDSDRGMVS